jgi:hypothetical protein
LTAASGDGEFKAEVHDGQIQLDVHTSSQSPAQPGGGTADFSAGPAGMVTLRQTGDNLEVVSVTPSPGWSFRLDHAGPDHHVEVHFTAASGGDGQFRAEVHDGQIRLDVHTKS